MEKTTPLRPGPARVLADNVNVRGKPTVKSEVVSKITKGQEVTVLEEITLKDSGPDEPSAWAKILLPQGTRVWVHAMFIDADTKKVKARRLNVRSGPGENYSVLGLLEQGQAVDDSQVKGDWLEIDPPANAYAFVAAQYLRQEPEATVAGATTAPSEPVPAKPDPTPVVTETTAPPTAEPVSEPPVVAAAPTGVPSAAPGTEAAPAKPVENVQAPGNETAAEVSGTPGSEEEPLPPRIVQREGVVRGTSSIQAPTRFELFSPDSGRVINYLYIDARDLDLSRYKGLRIIATGEEGLDERWRNTPVLNVQRLQVLE